MSIPQRSVCWLLCKALLPMVETILVPIRAFGRFEGSSVLGMVVWGGGGSKGEISWAVRSQFCSIDGTWGAPGQDLTLGGWGGSTDPKMVVQNNGFCGRCRRRKFCFRHTGNREKIFGLTLCVCTQNTQNFEENSKMDEKHKKGF